MRKLMILAGLTLALSAHTTAMASDAWTVSNAMKPKVAAVLKTSPIAAEMRREEEPNRPVRLLRDHGPKTLMSHDLIACLHLTNPKSDMQIDSGGGFDIDLTAVDFPGGNWDVHLRIREMQKIDELDSKPVLVLDKLVIGTLRFRELNKLSRALKLLTKTCYG